MSIYRIHVYIRAVWGAAVPQKPKTHYKNKIKWRLFLYSEPGYFFFRPGHVIFLLFSKTGYFFLLSSEPGYFFLAKPEAGIVFGNCPGLPPPPQNIKWSAPKAYIQSVVKNGPAVSEESQLRFSYVNDLGPK